MKAWEYKDAIKEIVKRNGLDKRGGWCDVPVTEIIERNRVFEERVKTIIGDQLVKVTGSEFEGKLFKLKGVVPQSPYYMVIIQEDETGKLDSCYYESVIYKQNGKQGVRLTMDRIENDNVI